MNDVPFCDYSFTNVFLGDRNPAKAVFAKYLMQRAISVFKWRIPENWDKDYFLYSLYTFGKVAVFKTDRFGVIPQQCQLGGYNLYKRPKWALVTSPCLTPMTNVLEIGRKCHVFSINPDFSGILDLVNFYSDMMALCAQTAAINILGCTTSKIFGCKNKAAAESYKKMVEEVLDRKPAVFADKSLFNNDGSPAWIDFTQNLHDNYIAGELHADLKKWERMFDTEIGIPNANTDKKERLLTDEVNSNNTETYAKSDLWYEKLEKTCKDCSDMFSIEISVEWRFPREEGGQNANANNRGIALFGRNNI